MANPLTKRIRDYLADYRIFLTTQLGSGGLTMPSGDQTLMKHSEAIGKISLLLDLEDQIFSVGGEQ